MPRTTSSPSDRPKWLRFDANDEETELLFAPAADWRRSSNYPAVKPLNSYKCEDYLRLAWELLRRMPRYRRQLHKLGRLGINSPGFYKKSSISFYSNDRPLPGFPRWQEYPLVGHKCEPAPTKDCATLGAYIAAHEAAGQPWFVMNRYRWVMDFWGLAFLPSPDSTFDESKNRRLLELFSPSSHLASVISNEAPANRPQIVSTHVRANEILVRLRLDSSLELQMDSIQSIFDAARDIASKRQNATLDPLPKTVRPKSGKIALREDPSQTDFSLRAAGQAGRARIKHVEMHPFWLRVWDALAEARIEQGTLTPRLNRDAIAKRFLNDDGRRSGADSSQTTSESTRNSEYLKNLVAKATDASMVPNWRARSEKYIEESDEAFRQIVAMAFAMKAD